MKKITLFFTLTFIFFVSTLHSQIINVPANWPDLAWTIGGAYSASGFVNDPRVTANFSWDEDLAGSGSLFDDIAAESPTIDITPAFPTEQQLQVQVNYVYRRAGDVLTLEWWDQDTGTWQIWQQFNNNSSNLDFETCSGMQSFSSQPLLTSGFSATQRLTFRYRIRFNDNGFDWGMCFESPTLTSIPTSPCIEVSAITIDGALITGSQAVIDWTENNVPPPANGWEIEYGVTGFAQGTGMVVPVNIHPFTLTGLTANTNYDVYIRALCSNTEQSAWVGPNGFTTANAAPNNTCGGQFVDSGGDTGQYGNNENTTTTICPDNVGDVVTVNFLSFNTETNFDDLTIYDGDTATSPLLGTYDGTNIPPTFTSTHATGCLTFVFQSDGSVTRDGWVANIICSPPPTCFAVTNIVINNITDTSADVSWTDNNTPPPLNGWEVEVVPSGTTPTGVGMPTTTNPFNLSGLNSDTTYDVYVRAICDNSGANDPSFWIATTFTTMIAPPVCGGMFVDSGGTNSNYSNNENVTTTICPINAGDVVSIQFISFDVETNFDDLSIYDGDSAASPLLGVFDGNALPPTFISSHATGCLTFVFNSDFTVTRAGWEANVVCAPPPTCFVVSNIAASNITINSAQISWIDNNPVTPTGGWDVEYGVAGFTQGTGLVDTSVTNPHTINGLASSTNYDVYVRANCAADTSDSSLWIGPFNFRTDDAPPPNDTCATAIPLIVDIACVPTLGNNILATSSTDLEGEIMPNCADPAANGAGAFDALDIWFTFVVPASGNVMIETSSVGGGMTDTVLSAYSGSCGNFIELDCQDDSVMPNSTDSNFSSIALQNLNSGDTIYVRVWSYDNPTNGNIQGAFNICVYGQSRSWNGTLENEDIINDVQLSYYPNPVTNILNVIATKEISNIVLYSILGQEVIRKSFNSTKIELNIETLSSGTYFAKVLVEGKTKTFKVIKK